MKKKTRPIKSTEQTHPLTWRVREDHDPVFLDEYLNKNGYKGAKHAIRNMDPNQIINLIKHVKLRGRGGAGFFTWIKWDSVLNNKNEKVHYLICNADEMEPGTYKDRFLMENLPHLLIEGMLIAAFALQANRGYIFLRGEYIQAEKYLNKAIQESQLAKFLGNNIFNTEFNFDLFIHSGAGRYICGEETALINSLEGNRPIPRFKPPFPTEFGLWGKPTCVNNVETLCNLPSILEHGEKWYIALNNNMSKDSGTKLIGFSGSVNNPGLWELPFGINSREVFEDYAGGIRNNLTLKAWQPGGAGTDFLIEKHLDFPMDFTGISQAGSRLGTGIAIAIDNTVNMVSVVYNLEKFFSRESCGWCTPCRDGLPWSVKILKELKKKRGNFGDIELLEELCQFFEPGKTFCAHAIGAAAPLKSAIKYFRNEFELGIAKKNIRNLKKIVGIQEN